MKSTTSFHLRVLGATAGLLIPAVAAHADTGADTGFSYASLAAQIQQSGSVQLLAKLFGSWVLNLYGGSGQGVTEVSTPITLFAALIGMAGWTLFLILAGYVGIVGLIKSATDGEFLGRDWSATWVLARVLAALVLSAPISATGSGSGIGISVGQSLVIRAAMLSSAAADIVWGKTLAALAQERISTDPSLAVSVNVSDYDAWTLLQKGFAQGVCVSTKAVYDPALSTQSTETPVKDVAQFANDCGMDTRSIDKVAAGVQLQDTESVNSGGINLWYLPEQTHRAKVIADAARSIAETYYEQAVNLGRQTVASGGDPFAVKPQIAQLVTAMQSALQQGVQTQLQSSYQVASQQFASDAQKFGWVSAGNYTRVLAVQQTAVNSALSTALDIGGRAVDPSSIAHGVPGDDMIYYNVTRAVTFEDYAKPVANAASATGSVVSQASGALFDALGVNLLQGGVTRDPLMVSANIGHGMQTVSQWYFVAKLVGPGFFAKVSSIFMGSGIDTFMAILFGIGILLGDVIPSLPWLFFLFGTIAWLIHVCEMFTSAPLWIAAHAAPEGRAHTSNLAAKGYNNLLFVMLYPTLAIGGFVAASAVCWIGMFLLNQLIAEQFLSQLGGIVGGVAHGLGTVLAFAGIYLVGAWMIVNMSFSLIQSFPRTILNWLSASEAGMNAFEQGGQRVLGSAGVLVSKTVSSGAGITKAAKITRRQQEQLEPTESEDYTEE